MRNRLNVLVLAQYFPPDMGGGIARASNVVKGLLSKGCEVKVVAAFPHYPQGNVPEKYSGKPIVSEQFNGAKVLRVWIPSLPHSSIVNRVVLHLCFVFSSLFALPFVGKADVVWAANSNLFCFYSAVVYGFVKRVPIVRNVDDLWPEVFYELELVRSALTRRFLDFLAWLSYVVPAAITPISAGYERRIVEKYGVCAEKTIRMAKKAGLKTGSYFIIGHPFETTVTIRDTIQFATKLNTDTLSFGIMVPYPGTEVYEMAIRREGGYRSIDRSKKLREEDNASQ